MIQAFICDGIRTPIGRFGGALSTVRTDDLAAIPIRALMERNPGLDPEAIDDVYYGCLNQAGEDNRNVARIAVLLAGLPVSVPGITLNRISGSGLEAIGAAARAIRCGEASLCIAGGVESLSRSPFVMPRPDRAFPRSPKIYETIGSRFANPIIQERYGDDPPIEMAELLAAEHGISRQDQDAFACQSHQRTIRAQEDGTLAEEIVPVTVQKHKGETVTHEHDEGPRRTSLEALAKLSPVIPDGGTVTAGNASGYNDGACALIIASEAAAAANGLVPLARVVATAAAGVPPRVFGIGPVPAAEKVMKLAGLKLSDIDVIEFNEVFAAQALAVIRAFGLRGNEEYVNPNGGALALGHPYGMSGARLTSTAMRQLGRTGGRFALMALPVGFGQGSAGIIERM